jgi:hypothetical protein
MSARRKGRPQNDEGPSDEDLERFGDVTQTCPKCGVTLYDDVVVCWKCGHALLTRPKGPPLWVVIVAIMMAAVLVLLLIR